MLRKSQIVFLYDILMVPIAWLLAYSLRYNLSEFSLEIFDHALYYLPSVIVLQAAACWCFGLYRGVWRFASVPDLLKIIKAAAIGAMSIFFLLFLTTRMEFVPRSVIPLYFMLYTILLGGSRFFYRSFKDHGSLFANKKRVLIIGAGQAGESLVRSLLRSNRDEYLPVAFVDDDLRKVGGEIHGVRVVGNCAKIPELIKSLNIDLIMMAIASISSVKMREIVEKYADLGVPFRTLPSVDHLAQGRVTIDAMREVKIEDLLGRDPVKLDIASVHEKIRNKVVLVTGGGGSIGSEFCRQLVELKPAEIIILDHSEENLYNITYELKQKYPNLPLVRLLVDITDRNLVDFVFKNYSPQIIFHAAAYKHVPMLESQILLAVKNNINGTRNVADMAAKYHVETFVLISTDKAVNPTNIMGMTKRIAEIYCQNLNQKSPTNYITVRFGNVLGSAGSVVPLFRKQLQGGGPLTVTHPDMTRFFMTIKEAVSLVLQASVMGQGGEIFVLDMGEPVSIRYLAEQMILLAGRKVDEDIKIVYTGMRPGEKLYEELFHSGETLAPTRHEKISKALSRQHEWEIIISVLSEMDEAYKEFNEEKILSLLLQLVPEYIGNIGPRMSKSVNHAVANHLTQ